MKLKLIKYKANLSLDTAEERKTPTQAKRSKLADRLETLKTVGDYHLTTPGQSVGKRPIITLNDGKKLATNPKPKSIETNENDSDSDSDVTDDSDCDSVSDRERDSGIPVAKGFVGVSYEEYQRLLERVDAMTSQMDLAINNGMHRLKTHEYNEWTL